MEDLLKRKKELGKKLNQRQKMFCKKYIETKCNAAEAARLAGYSQKTARQIGSRLLTNVDILAYTHILQEMLVKQTVLSKDKIILDLLEIKERCMQAVPVEKWNYDTHEYEETGEYVFDSKGAINSLDKISKMCGFATKEDEKNNEIRIVIESGNGNEWSK